MLKIQCKKKRTAVKNTVIMMMIMVVPAAAVARTKAASQSYQTLSPGGGVAEGEVLQNSPGCSGMSESGPCKPGGVDEVLRANVDEPLRDTQEVSMTRTPMLWWWTKRKMEKQ